MTKIALAMLGALSAAPILAHEAPSGWHYPGECCGGNDCHPIACSTVQEHPDGSVSWLGLNFPRQMVRNSGDGECHVCISVGVEGFTPTNKTFRNPHCIFLSPVF